MKKIFQLALLSILLISISGNHISVVDKVSAREVSEYVFRIDMYNETHSYNKPLHIEMNSTHFFVSDGFRGVAIYDGNGNYVHNIGSHFGSGDYKFNQPRDVSHNGTHIIIVDQNNYRIQIFDAAATYKQTIGGTQGSGDYQFDIPNSVVSNGTHIFVSDSMNHRIQIFDAAGVYKDTISGIFNQPTGLAHNGSHLFVVDKDNNRIIVFDSAGTYVTQFGDGLTQLYDVAVDTINDYAYVTTSDGVRIYDFRLDYIGIVHPVYRTSPPGNPNALLGLSGIAVNSTHIAVTEDPAGSVLVSKFNPITVTNTVTETTEQTSTITTENNVTQTSTITTENNVTQTSTITTENNVTQTSTITTENNVTQTTEKISTITETIVSTITESNLNTDNLSTSEETPINIKLVYSGFMVIVAVSILKRKHRKNISV